VCAATIYGLLSVTSTPNLYTEASDMVFILLSTGWSILCVCFVILDINCRLLILLVLLTTQYLPFISLWLTQELNQQCFKRSNVCNIRN